MKMKKYLVTEENTVHGFEVYSQHDIKAEAEAKREGAEKIVEVEILDEIADYTNEGESVEYAGVTVSALIDGESHEANYSVQLTGGEYLSQMGCWITTNGGDCEFSDVEKMIYEVANVVGAAEKAASDFDSNQYEYLDSNFNCAINSNSLYVRVNKQDGSATLVIKDLSHNSHDYSVSQSEHETFDTQEEAFAFLEQFRTDEYQDCRGLYAYMNRE